MRQFFRAAAFVAFLSVAAPASAVTVTYDFEDGTDQGWGRKFAPAESSDASETFPIANVGGSNRLAVLRDGDFQEAEIAMGATGLPFYQAMQAASADEAGYEISYDWYVDTSTFGGGAGTYLQLGTYVNTGTGYYKQNFPDPGTKEVELNGTQLASGQVFSGTKTETFAAKGFDLPAGETFFRLGLILNGDGANQVVHFDNVSVRPVPEPASLALLAILPALALRRRRLTR